MKKDLSNNKAVPETENIMILNNQQTQAKRWGFIFDWIPRTLIAAKQKRFFRYRRKQTRKDGSVCETEIIYRDDL